MSQLVEVIKCEILEYMMTDLNHILVNCVKTLSLVLSSILSMAKMVDLMFVNQHKKSGMVL